MVAVIARCDHLWAHFYGAIINWYAHKYGYRNFKLKNTSQNLLMVDVVMLGESYHNNHHKNPNSINFGKRWHEIDPVYPLIRLLAWFRIIGSRNSYTSLIITGAGVQRLSIFHIELCNILQPLELSAGKFLQLFLVEIPDTFHKLLLLFIESACIERL